MRSDDLGRDPDIWINIQLSERREIDRRVRQRLRNERAIAWVAIGILAGWVFAVIWTGAPL